MQIQTKLLALSFVLILWPRPDLSAANEEYLKYFRTDSAFVYSYNPTDGTWIPSSVQKYQYEHGKLMNVFTLDYYTRADQGWSEYSYNDEGLAERVVNYYYSNGWVAATRNLYTYDPYGRITEIRVQKYINSVWTDDRIQKDYQYDINGNLTEYEMIYWRNGEWTTPTTDYSFYDDSGRLIRREALYYSGLTDYRILYEYNEFDLLSEMYSQYPYGGTWNNLWKADYQYDPCGLKISQVQYSGSETSWIPSTKTVSFSYFKPELYPRRKIAICHKGHTIVVSINAVEAHLKHGDCLGPCPGCSREENGDFHSDRLNKTIPFTVYPNPAGEYLTVTMKRENTTGFSRIELLDMEGKILRSITSSDERQITISRNGLIGGQYFLRVYAGELYSQLVIFR